MVFRRHLIELLSDQPRSASSLARELGLSPHGASTARHGPRLRRGDIESDLQHAIRSARAAGRRVEVIPARCKDCGFLFGEDRLVKPGRCPACKGSRLFEPMIRVADESPEEKA